MLDLLKKKKNYSLKFYIIYTCQNISNSNNKDQFELKVYLLVRLELQMFLFGHCRRMVIIRLKVRISCYPGCSVKRKPACRIWRQGKACGMVFGSFGYPTELGTSCGERLKILCPLNLICISARWCLMDSVTFVDSATKTVSMPCGIVMLQGPSGRRMFVLILCELKNSLPLQTRFSSCARMVLLIYSLGLLWLLGVYGSAGIGCEWDNPPGR